MKTRSRSGAEGDVCAATPRLVVNQTAVSVAAKMCLCLEDATSDRPLL